MLALLSDTAWARWSDREIARQCMVSNSFVTVLRRIVEGPSPDPKRRRLAAQAGHIISRPAEHHKEPTSSNGNDGKGPGKMTRCPFCKKRFEIP
jgi:hypothetical protein